MALVFHVHLHGDVEQARRHREVMEAISNLEDTYMALSAKLQAAVDDVNNRLGQTNTELDAIATALNSQDQVTGAAVATALAKAGVDEDAAAALISSATQSVREHVDSIFAKVGVTPPATTGTLRDTTGAPAGGTDSVAGGQGDDALNTGGAASEPAPNAADSPTGGDGADTVEVAELKLVTTSLPDAVVGVPYTASLEATGGTGALKFSSSPPIANGISVLSSGAVNGQAEVAEDSTFSVTVTDSADPPKQAFGAVTLHTTAPASEQQ